MKLKPTSTILFLALVGALFTLYGCSANQSGRVYSQGQAQRSLSVYYGTIIELQEVTIEGSSSGAGSVIGGIAGGVAGSTIGHGRGSTLASVAGALVGAIAGSAIEKESGTKAALEFTIELDNGRLIAIVQEHDGDYRIGDRVRLLQGDDGIWRVRQ
jgi:outer membrane lipoprotein SlyB